MGQQEKEAKGSSGADETAAKEVRQEESKEASKPAAKEATSIAKAPTAEEKEKATNMQKSAVEKTLQLAIE